MRANEIQKEKKSEKLGAQVRKSMPAAEGIFSPVHYQFIKAASLRSEIAEASPEEISTV